jgi:Protein of unknown function (DUF5818)
MAMSLESVMKTIYAAFGIAAMCAVGAGAQSGTTQTKTKVEVKDGKDVKINGCLASNPAGGYILTNANGNLKYELITDDDLSKHVGHRVEVEGKAADKGDGKVKIESSVESGGSDTKSKTETELKGSDMAGMRYLGVKSVKMISATCD